MLKTILSVSGKPGLFKLVNSTNKMIIVESLTNNRKIPIHTQDKVVSLGDISIYTITDEAPLRNILIAIKEKESGKETSIQPSAKPAELLAYFGEILPDYDKDRVFSGDIKKILSWYNLLIESKLDFEKKIEEESKNEKKEEN